MSVSNCCGAGMSLDHDGDEHGSNWYVCDACGKACDAVDERGGNVTDRAQEILREAAETHASILKRTKEDNHAYCHAVRATLAERCAEQERRAEAAESALARMREAT